MNRIFNLDNPFFVFMGRLADLFLLNVAFVICCIPIVTIGPALSAMFYVTMKMVKNEESYIFRSFFHSFKQNLKQGIIIHLILLVIGVILLGDFYITARMAPSTTITVLRVLLLAISIFYFMVYLYVYPVLAKFYNSIKHTFRNSILMAIRHLPQTVIMSVVALSPLALLLVKDAMIESTIIFVLILIGPSTIAYINSRFFVKVFSNYIKEEPEEEEYTDENTTLGIYDAVITPVFPETAVSTDTTEETVTPENEEEV